MIEWLRGETRTLVLTVTVDGTAQDLSDATAIEYQLKAAVGDPDPPLIALSIGAGVTLREQLGDDVGVADIVISSAAADALEPGLYAEEVVAIFPGDLRRYLAGPRLVEVIAVVNRR